MVTSHTAENRAVGASHEEADLGPLAWVLDETRKSMESVIKLLRRFATEAQTARGVDLATVDASQLRVVRQQLHQVVGALDMVGQAVPAQMVRGMEVVVQQFIAQPEKCTEEAVQALERPAFALVEYLESQVSAAPRPALGLFPQYRQIEEMAGADRIHPADLWSMPWRWADPATPAPAQVLEYGADVRSRLDQRVLKIMRFGDTNAAAELSLICLGLAQGESARQANAFWKLAAAFFEAIAQAALPVDIYVKRTASRVLLQYAALARGDKVVSERLAHDLLFFSAQARHVPGVSLPVVDAVRQAWGLADAQPHDYEQPVFGLYDPAVLAQARRRIEALKENWSALAGGDMARARASVDQFALVGESLTKLHAEGGLMADVLNRIAVQTAQSGHPPHPELAMEVATAVLFLEVSFADFQPADAVFSERVHELVERLETAQQGQPVPPLQAWMEELYRSVSDRQTMGTVVAELRATLDEVEQHLDQFFRTPEDKSALASVPGLMGQMRGVLSVLGLDQAALAVAHMRDLVENLLHTEEPIDNHRSRGAFDHLGASVSALGFQVNMLAYQPLLARTLFAYDAQTGELKYLGSRQAKPAAEAAPADAGERVDLLLDDTDAGAEAGQAPADFAPSITATLPENLVDFSLPSSEMAQPLAQLAATAALEGKPALAQAASRAADAARNNDSEGLSGALQALQAVAKRTPEPVAAPAPAPAPAAPALDIDDELLEIFLEEAKEVVRTGSEAVQALRTASSDAEQQTTLRRAFHTLKGSSRMVGLSEFGEAAWSMEQLLNAWLADKKPASDDLLNLSQDALQAFGAWVEDIAAKTPGQWSSEPFRTSADDLRLLGAYVPLAAGPSAPAQPDAAPAFQPATTLVEADAAPALEAVAEAPAPAQDEIAEASALSAEDEALVAIFPGSALPASDARDDQADPPFGDTLLLDEEPAQALEAPALPDAEPLLDLSDWAAASALPAADAQPEAADPSAEEWADAPVLSVEAVPVPDAVPASETVEVVDAQALQAPALPDENAPLPGVDDASALSGLQVQEGESVDEALGLSLNELDFTAEESALSDLQAPEVLDASDAPALPDLPDLPDLSLDAAPVVALDAGLAPALDEPSAPPDFVAEVSPEADSYQQVGDLRISTPLFNVYLNEADAWSHRLESALQAWAQQPDQPVPELAIVCAHSLVGSSATVGFVALSDMARALEHALQRLAAQDAGTPEQLRVLTLAAADIRKVLFQFATGVLQAPSADVLAQVQALAPSLAPPAAKAAPAPVAAPVSAPVAAPAPVPAVAPAPSYASALSEGIDQTDAIDPDLFPIFAEEAEELFPQMASALRTWVQSPQDLSARAQVLRALHTLKGSARLAGALRLGEMAHRTESTIETIGTEGVSTADLAPLLDSLDDLDATFRALQAGDQGVEALAPPSEAAPMLGALVDLPDLELAAPAPAPAAAAAPHAPAPAAAAPVQPVVRGEVAQPAQLSLVAARTSATQAVRVRAQVLDRLVAQAGEIITSRARLEAEMGIMRSSLTDLTNNLDRLRLQLRDVELQAETQMQSRLALSKDAQQNFDPLEFDRFTRMQELTRIMAESVNDVATVQRTLQRAIEASEDDLVAQARQSRELQRDLLRTRMVEFDSLSERLYRVVRQAAKENGKQVRLDIIGGAIEMDRSILERMTPAFEHLLRNCVVHGIETQELRAQRGKDAAGLITIEVQQAGNDVSVQFRDDGNGLNAARIREQAVRRGLIGADQSVSDAEVLNFIFAPGFTTASEVTALAGRGVGMDVVRTEVQALGGRIETSSQAGQGASFRLVLPLTTAVTHVVMLRAGSLVVGVSSNLVEIVRRTTAADLQAAYASGRYPVGEDTVPFYWAGALLQSSARSAEPPSRSTPVVILKSAAQCVALHVDEVLGNQEVVVKALGPQLARLPGLVAITALASGAVSLIYNPVALAAVYGSQAAEWTASASAAAAEAARPEKTADAGAASSDIPLVLVVDDSITVRRVTQRLLQREGYRVALAADGLQGLEQLQGERPAVVLSDIEMPRMDGFDFVRNIRADEQLRDLPVIMITSRIAEKHREHARDLGVNHYLGKPYSEEELLGLIKNYAHAARVAA